MSEENRNASVTNLEQLAQLRKENAEKCSAELPPLPNANVLAKKLHPHAQAMVVTEVREETGDMKTIRMAAADGHELAYFRAGQYIPVCVEIDGNTVERPYSLTASPEESLNGGYYEISVKRAGDGYISNFLNDTVKVGTKLTLGAPMGFDFYTPLRDCPNIIGIAGGSGVTPFRSMARAICDGTMDAHLTLIYGVNKISDIAFSAEWPEYEKQTGGKVKCVPVIAYEEAEGCEHGYVTLDIIKKYADIENASFFISGPQGLMDHMHKVLGEAGIRRKFTRFCIHGDAQFAPSEDINAEYTLTVHMAGETCKVKAFANETILRALEKAQLKPMVKCRSGACGYCRSYLVSGEFEMVEGADWRRRKDKILGFIHPCCSFPRSDMEIVVHRA